jgi:hypothetical protein
MGLFHKKPKNPILEKAEQERNIFRADLNAKYKRYNMGTCMYHGGLPCFGEEMKNHTIEFDTYSGGVLFEAGPTVSTNYIYYHYFLPISKIVNYSERDLAQIKRDVTLPRVLVLGVLSLAVQKKTETGTSYLLINYRDSNEVKQSLFSNDVNSDAFSHIERDIDKAKKQYLNSPQAVKDAQEAEAKQKEQPVAAETDSPDIPGQIERLSDLFKKGILTEQEFNSKKAELLAKI